MLLGANDSKLLGRARKSMRALESADNTHARCMVYVGISLRTLKSDRNIENLPRINPGISRGVGRQYYLDIIRPPSIQSLLHLR